MFPKQDSVLKKNTETKSSECKFDFLFQTEWGSKIYLWPYCSTVLGRHMAAYVYFRNFKKKKAFLFPKPFFFKTKKYFLKETSMASPLLTCFGFIQFQSLTLVQNLISFFCSAYTSKNCANNYRIKQKCKKEICQNLTKHFVSSE